MRKNIVLSMQAAEVEMLDKIAERLGLSRSACVRLLVARYFKDCGTEEFWREYWAGTLKKPPGKN